MIGFGHIERGSIAALATASPCRRGDGHVVSAHSAFCDDASDGGFQTRFRSSLLERISSRRRFWLFAQNHQLFAV